MTIRMNAKLPSGDGNGLEAITPDLIKDPKRYRVCLAIIDSKETVTDHDSGDLIPKLRVRRIEVVLEDDLAAAERMMRRSLESRSGGEALPMDLHEDIDRAFEPDEWPENGPGPT